MNGVDQSVRIEAMAMGKAVIVTRPKLDRTFPLLHIRVCSFAVFALNGAGRPHDAALLDVARRHHGTGIRARAGMADVACAAAGVVDGAEPPAALARATASRPS